MTWRTVLALAVFVMMCGFIAYWGDLLGRRMGKRRLMLFGLRPRYTAILTTSVTGMLIAVFTIGAMATLSKEIRYIISKGERIVLELRDTQREYHAAQEQLRVAGKRLDQQKQIVTNARKEVQKAVAERKELASEIKTLTGNLDKLKIDLRKNEAELANSEKQLVSARNDLSSAKKEIAVRRKDIDTLRKTQRELVDTTGSSLFEKNVIFRPHQEISRRVISCTQAKSEIRANFIGLLNDAGKKAREKGARIGENGRAVRILPKMIDKRLYKESEIIDAVVDQISGSSGFVVARVFSFGNSFEGQQVVVDCEINYNRFVYASGDEVASISIDGRDSRGQILGTLIAFLKTDVRAAATQKGVIPVYDEDGHGRSE